MTSIVNEREWCTELSTCSFQFGPKTHQTMPLYAYLTPKVDFKCKFNHHQSFLYEWRLTAQTIRKFRIGPSLRIELGVRFEIESNREASQVPNNITLVVFTTDRTQVNYVPSSEIMTTTNIFILTEKTGCHEQSATQIQKLMQTRNHGWYKNELMFKILDNTLATEKTWLTMTGRTYLLSRILA